MKRQFSQYGFTLVEVLVSVVLLAMVIAGSYTLIGRATALMRSARNHYVALNLCKNRLERARIMAYRDLPLLAETNMQVDANGVVSSLGDFRRSTILGTNAAAGMTELIVNTEVRSVRSQTFRGEMESASCLFTEFLTMRQKP